MSVSEGVRILSAPPGGPIDLSQQSRSGYTGFIQAGPLLKGYMKDHLDSVGSAPGWQDVGSIIALGDGIALWMAGI